VTISESGRNLGSLLIAFALISIAYLAAFSLSMDVLLPWQQQYTPEMAAYASLLFLPHGVRVLSAWLMGWKAIPLLLPAAAFTHWLNFGLSGFTPLQIIGLMSGVVCAVVTFWALARAGMDFRITSGTRANWRDILIAGCIASVINTGGMLLAFQQAASTSAGYLVGDVSGMFACMLILMLAFKVLRRFETVSD
jgi:uncharacterized membrane protein YwzB